MSILRPIADSSLESTPSTGTSGYAVIDEAILDTGDYLGVTANSDTVALVFYDEFEFTELTSDSVISGVSMMGNLGCIGWTAGYYKIRFFVKISGTRYFSDYFNIQASSAPFSYKWAINPSTGTQWVKADVNGMTAGIEHTVLGSYDYLYTGGTK